MLSSTARRHLGAPVRSGAALCLLVAALSPLGSGRTAAAPPKRAAQGAPATPVERAPDVIVVMVDTLRADALDFGPQGNRSPALATFAQRATRFSRAYAQAPWTAPSVASLLTSKYPAELGTLAHPQPLPASATTLAEAMADRGYRTIGVTTNPFITSRNHFERGFDTWDQTLMPDRHLVTSQAVTDRVLKTAADTDPDTPLFVYAHYFDPHYDYVLHPGFEPEGLPAPGCDHVSIGILRPKAKHARGALGERDLQVIRRHYASEVAFTDHHVGRLFDGLRAQGRFEHAVVVFTADHGEAFLEHDHLGHTVNVFEELVHVPLLVKAPGQSEGVVVDAPVALIDVVPTVLDLAGLPPLDTVRGVSLRRLPRARPVFTVTHRPRLRAAVIEGPHKLIYDGPSQRYSLYDLRADPFEDHEGPAAPDVTAKLSVLLDDWLAGTSPDRPVADMEFSPQEQALLRALGYGE